MSISYISVEACYLTTINTYVCTECNNPVILGALVIILVHVLSAVANRLLPTSLQVIEM